MAQEWIGVGSATSMERHWPVPQSHSLAVPSLDTAGRWGGGGGGGGNDR